MVSCPFDEEIESNAHEHRELKEVAAVTAVTMGRKGLPISMFCPQTDRVKGRSRYVLY